MKSLHFMAASSKTEKESANITRIYTEITICTVYTYGHDSRPFVPGSEKTIEGTFAPVELSFHGTFAPGNFRSFSFLGSEGSKNFRSVEHLLSWNFRSSGANVPRTFVPMKLSYHENEYFENFRSKCPKTRPINLTIAYAH